MKFIFIISLLFLVKKSYNQETSYQDYYNIIHEAEYSNYSKKYNKSFSQYIKAFRTKYPFNNDISKALSVSTILLESGDSSLLKEYELVEKLQEVFFSENLYKKVFIKNSEKEQLITFFPYLCLEDFSKPDENTIQLTIQLSNYLFADQTIRKTSKKNSEYRDYMLHAVDSIIYREFVAYLMKNGMPNRKLIGKYYHNLQIILLHGSFSLGISTELNSILKSSILLGNYNPSNYAFLIDKYNTWNLDKPQIYGQFCNENYELRNIEDIANVDKRRKSIGLESLGEYAEKNYFRLPIDYIKKL